MHAKPGKKKRVRFKLEGEAELLYPRDCEPGRNDDCMGVPEWSVVGLAVKESESDKEYRVVRGHLHEDAHAYGSSHTPVALRLNDHHTGVIAFSIPNACRVNGLLIDSGVYNIHTGTICVCLANSCSGDIYLKRETYTGYFEISDKRSHTKRTYT